MPNEVKYSNVNWGEDSPIAGERLSTNGFHTGEHKGTVMQDSKNASDANAAHYVEGVTVRYGTMMQDAIDPNQPKVATAE